MLENQHEYHIQWNCIQFIYTSTNECWGTAVYPVLPLLKFRTLRMTPHSSQSSLVQWSNIVPPLSPLDPPLCVWLKQLSLRWVVYLELEIHIHEDTYLVTLEPSSASKEAILWGVGRKWQHERHNRSMFFH